MTKAIEQIVDTYVRLDNVRALQDMKAHRQKLVAGARGRTDFDFSLLLAAVDEEIALIDDALDKLQPARDVAESEGDGADAAGTADIDLAGEDDPE